MSKNIIIDIFLYYKSIYRRVVRVCGRSLSQGCTSMWPLSTTGMYMYVAALSTEGLYVYMAALYRRVIRVCGRSLPQDCTCVWPFSIAGLYVYVAALFTTELFVYVAAPSTEGLYVAALYRRVVGLYVYVAALDRRVVRVYGRSLP